MDIKIESLDHIHEAAQQFIDNMGKGNVFAFYGKMGAGRPPLSRLFVSVCR